MKPLWDSHRGKGRTQRMLQTAVAKMFAGCSVFVVVRQSQMRPMMDRLAFLAPKAEAVNDHEVSQYGGFIRLVALPHAMQLQALLCEGRLYGTSDDAVILVDHHVIEQECGFVLQQWLLWCGPEFGIIP